VDVNGDNVVTPLDVLAVIDKINAASGSGEGEGSDAGGFVQFAVGPGLVNSSPKGQGAPIDFGVSSVQVGRELPTSSTSVGSTGMMKTLIGPTSSSANSFPVEGLFEGDLWDSEFDEIAGILSQESGTATDDSEGNDSLDHALMDLFGN
jgi:hypothetical protein